MVNVGSGISILKVTGPSTFTRVTGTAIGGGTFWGLTLALTNIDNFDKVLQCVKPGGGGDNKNVDLLVSDIYGEDTIKNTGNLIASSFGKLQRNDKSAPEYRDEDIVKSLQFMVTDNFTQIAFLTAQLNKFFLFLFLSF